MGWDNNRWDYMDQMHNGSEFWGLGMGIIFLIFVGVVVWLLVRLSRNNKGAISQVLTPPAKENPREILDRRFASGEINADEYQHAKSLLSN